jgi:hypothetical protein
MDVLQKIRFLQEERDGVRDVYLATVAKKPVDYELANKLNTDRMSLNKRIARLRGELPN